MGRKLPVGEDWSQDVHMGNHSVLRFSYHVVCSEHYHGQACATYCRPRDYALGHYTCDAEGNRQCMEGWAGDYCSERECPLGGFSFLWPPSTSARQPAPRQRSQQLRANYGSGATCGPLQPCHSALKAEVEETISTVSQVRRAQHLLVLVVLGGS